MYVSLLPTLSCVVSFLSLYTCFLLFVCNLLFLFHRRCLDEFCLKCFRNTDCQSLLAINSLLAKIFKSLCYDRFYCIQQVNMSWVIYDFSRMFICLLWFCHGLPKGEIVRTYVFLILRTYVMSLCNWLILWQNVLYLYLGRLRMCLNTLRNHVSRSIVEAFKSVQEIKQECKFIKARQLVDSFSTPSIYWGLRISEFNSDFLGIRESVYGASFLLTLDI